MRDEERIPTHRLATTAACDLIAVFLIVAIAVILGAFAGRVMPFITGG